MAKPTERKLRSRKRKFSKGKAIRVSDIVFQTLDAARGEQSWDLFMRRMLGIPDRAGGVQPLIEGVIETLTGKFLLKTPAQDWEDLTQTAYEQGFIAAARQRDKRIRYVPKPIRVRELL